MRDSDKSKFQQSPEHAYPIASPEIVPGMSGFHCLPHWHTHLDPIRDESSRTVLRCESAWGKVWTERHGPVIGI